ncbi:MAG: hypothetical protein WC382_11795 [Methanoregulaceae archaeon]|jgi:hypothetical protein
MIPPRCRFCISHPAHRLKLLRWRQDGIREELRQLEDQLALVDMEIGQFGEVEP